MSSVNAVPIQCSTSNRRYALPSVKNYLERRHSKVIHQNAQNQMSRLTRSIDTNSKSILLANSPILNQRYQNVLKFPNYRPKKKIAFEKKLRRCGVELGGEATISNLRKILQPYIYQDINTILDKYIEVYFMKAFSNIDENVSLTSDNWSQTLRCSISKSLYKQYCEIASVDPFDSSSISCDDFPYFKTFQKFNHKDKGLMINGNSTKFDIENFTGHKSDTNSQYSQYAIVEDKGQIDREQTAAAISSFPEPIHFNGTADSHGTRKRNIELVDQMYSKTTNISSTFNETSRSLRKYPKMIFHAPSNVTNLYASHYIDDSTTFMSQIDNPTKESFDTIASSVYLNNQNSMTAKSTSEHLCAPHNHFRKL